jgi:zinc transporter, ZIP family
MPVEAADMLRVVALAAFAGGTSFLGALLSRYIRFRSGQILFLTSFGAGVLISAAIFEMVIEAEEAIGILATMIFFVIGSIIFTVADVIAERRGGGAGILLGIGLDSIPESLAIGASVASGAGLAVAVLIGIQNVPEGIASYREMLAGKTAFSNSRKALGAIGVVSAIPVALALVGLFYMQGMGTVIAVTLALSAGGIFYMLYYDMIPKAHRERKWLPSFGSVLGFIVGYAFATLLSP